jgi:predicted nuclease of predicted toxin-antitoxin system
MLALRGSLGDGTGTASYALRLRFLIDNALPPQVADLLVAAGHDAVHVRSYGMQAARDEEILARALEEDRIVVSADSDFGAILAAQEAERPSFLLFRDPNLLVAVDYVNMLLSALPVLVPELASGCVLFFDTGACEFVSYPCRDRPGGDTKAKPEPAPVASESHGDLRWRWAHA